MDEYFHKALLLAPCFGTKEGSNSANDLKEPSEYPGFVNQGLNSIGLWTVGGENWG